MRKIIICVLLFVFSLVGCAVKERSYPEWAENKEQQNFYNDMTNILPKIEKGLQQKKSTYYDKIMEEDLEKYKVKNLTIELNEKEKEILSSLLDVLFSYKLYIEAYYKSDEIYNDNLIDKDKLFGMELYKSLEKFIDLLEIDYVLD